MKTAIDLAGVFFVILAVLFGLTSFIAFFDLVMNTSLIIGDGATVLGGAFLSLLFAGIAIACNNIKK